MAVHLAAAAPAAAGGQQDLRYDQQGLQTVGAAEAWERNRGSGIAVAVLDTGVDDSHPDLEGGVAIGDDFTGQELGTGDGGYGEHGTALAGIIAASGHGQEHSGGVLGVAPEAEILSVRVAADGGEDPEVSEEALERGIRYAVSEGAQVIMLPDSDAGEEEQKAVGHAARNGVVVVAPVGSGLADHDRVLAVGAVDNGLASQEAAAGNGGAALSAPGTEVPAPAAGGGYTEVNGDAAAAAFVAGAAAMLRAEHPQLLPGQITEALVEGAQPAAGEDGIGVLHVPGAMAAAGETAEDVPLYNEDLVADEDEDPLVPMWAWGVGGAVLLIVLIAVGAVRMNRSLSNPYDLPRRDDAAQPAEPAEADAGRTGGRGRRRGRRRAR
ncbi:S8 family serine peptidase [Allosalinactinospora lopnorensis]|uniref:S8 family serine peptidase n=1 Tax=Allosalinactinospora lopnorensis TaxID=1352348 RepID=UPI0006982E7B|nr:S8 family serine peptidase [Allosalinactinospora lopnorensis]